MASETTTPNIGLQVPAFNQANWQVPTNYNWNLLDLIFGGEFEVPGLWVQNLVVGNIAGLLTPVFVKEAATGTIPGNTFFLTYPPALLFGFYWNGVFQVPGVDYTIASNTITTNFTPSSGDTLYAVYLR